MHLIGIELSHEQHTLLGFEVETVMPGTGGPMTAPPCAESFDGGSLG